MGTSAFGVVHKRMTDMDDPIMRAPAHITGKVDVAAITRKLPSLDAAVKPVGIGAKLKPLRGVLKAVGKV